jgi:hypothetical protein
VSYPHQQRRRCREQHHAQQGGRGERGAARGQEGEQQERVAEGPLVLRVEALEEAEDAALGERLEQLDPAVAVAGHVPHGRALVDLVVQVERLRHVYREVEGGEQHGRQHQGAKALHGEGAF